MSRHNSANIWFEPPATDAVDSPVPAFLQFITADTAYEVATTGSKDASLMDWHNAAIEYEMLITSSPYVLISSGGAIVPSASGTPAAILIDDGAYGLVATTDLTQTAAGAFYQAANGSLVAARFDSPQEGLAQVGTTIFSFTG